MKKMTTLLFLFLSTGLFAQDTTDFELKLLMAEHPNYISYKDSSLLPLPVKSSYNMVKEFLATKNENIEDYWVKTDFVIEFTSVGNVPYGDIEASGLFFPVYHTNTLKAVLQLKKEDPDKYNKLNNGTNTFYQMVGNASGRDGKIEISSTVTLTVWE